MRPHYELDHLGLEDVQQALLWRLLNEFSLTRKPWSDTEHRCTLLLTGVNIHALNVFCRMITCPVKTKMITSDASYASWGGKRQPKKFIYIAQDYEASMIIYESLLSYIATGTQVLLISTNPKVWEALDLYSRKGEIVRIHLPV